MECYECGRPARGICTTCGIGLCVGHGTLLEGVQEVRTGNVNQTEGVSARRFVCGVDAEAFAVR